MILLQLLVMVLTVIAVMDGHENLVPAKSGKKNQELGLTMKPILQVLERKKAACNSKKCKSCKKGCNHCKLCKVPATTPPTTATIEPAPGLPGTTCTESFNSIKVTGKKRKKTYKFICDFVMVYTNEAVKTSKSSVKCEGPSKVPQGLSAKVILIGDDGLKFTMTISLKPLSINIATVNGAKCNPAPEANSCNHGSPLTDASGDQLICGKRSNGQDCPNGSFCEDDKHFVCCLDGPFETGMLIQLNVSDAFSMSNLTEVEAQTCMNQLKITLRKFQETELLVESLRYKKAFIRSTKLTDKLGRDSRLLTSIRKTISQVSSEWTSTSKNETLIEYFSKSFQKWAEKEGGLSFLKNKTRSADEDAKEIFCSSIEQYRRIDGKCNNIANKRQGSAGIALKRFLENGYADGKSEPRGGLISSSLPSARVVSTKMHHADNPNPLTTKGYSHMVMQFGQFLDHDITLTPELELDCCDENNLDIGCFNIDITGDPFYSVQNHKCHAFTRSDSICTDTEVREQMNGNTAFIDASNVYGSEETHAKSLRTLADGKLKIHKDGPMLPTREQVNEELHKCQHKTDLIAGDIRASEQPTLSSIHSLFLNEHNRIAEELKSKLSQLLSSKSPNEMDEIVYQESRKIVGAEMQNIVYNEFLPIVLGKTQFIKHNLELSKVSQYDDKIDPSIRNEFATAAFRFGHSLIAGFFQGSGSNGGWNLSEQFFFEDPEFVSGKSPNNNGRAWHIQLEEASKQTCPADDLVCTRDITDFLFAGTCGSSSKFGDDLPARNIQRGRDHGIPSYNAARVSCGLSRLTSFDTKPEEISVSNWGKIKHVYDNKVDDIDLFTGGLAEIAPTDGLVGPTFACIIGKQFDFLKFGDRYFFNNEQGKNNNARGLKINSRNTVHQRTLGDIICDNTNAISLQKFVMKEEDIQSNPQQDCKSRNALDFEAIVSDISFDGKPCKDQSGELHQDGSMVTLESGTEIECCKGRWITLYNGPITTEAITTSTTTPFVDSSLVVTGGRGENGHLLASSEIITSEGVCLTSIPPLPVTLFGASSVYFDGSLMVCGGWHNGYQNKCYLLDSSTSTWRTGPQMTISRRDFTLTKVGGAVYAVGGYNGRFLDSMEKLEKLEGTSWTFLPQKMSSGTHDHCTVNIGNQLVVIGGDTRTVLGIKDKVESFDVSSGQWTPLAPLPLKLLGHKCTTFKEAIYVSGGGYYPYSNKVFMYQDGSWSTAGEMEVARAYHTMGVVDGKLLVAGGYNGAIALDSVETIDEQGQWKKLQWTVSKRWFSAMAQVPRDKFPCNP